ncbi:MAG: hypothetical protein IAG10_15930 [Planctomycetaceae bacterium]|nr:hypothetical protein [Planctomycetaceae bacterium]
MASDAMKKVIRSIVATLTLVGLVGDEPKLVENTSAQEANAVQSKDPVGDSIRLDLSRINVGTLNRFHLALVARVLVVMPEELQLVLEYGGIVAKDNGKRQARRGHGSIGAPLEWSILDKDGIGVFWLTIASQRNDRSVCACRLGKETVFVEIIGIDGIKKVDKNSLTMPLKTLGGRSGMDVIKLLESEPGELERQ